jgi:hypothetical protein
MKAPPDLAHQPNLPVLSTAVPWLSTLQSETPPLSGAPPGDHAALPRPDPRPRRRTYAAMGCRPPWELPSLKLPPERWNDTT